MYALVRAMGRGLVRGYYRVEVIGTPHTADGPLIVVANHTNGLVDGGLVLESTRRHLRLLVKISLMRMPIFGLLLRAISAIPLHRKKDGADTARNEGSFDAVQGALTAGEPILLFPEGTSSGSPGLGRFKTGAARMALGAEEAGGFDLGLRILPLGIVYEDVRRFRSRAVVTIGEPFEVAHWQAAYERESWAAVEGLTAEIEHAIRELAQRGETYEEIDERIDAETLAPPDGRTRHARWQAIAEAQRRVGLGAAEDGDELEVRRRVLQELRKQTGSMGLSLSEALRLSQDSSFWRWIAALPVVLGGAFVWGPLVLLARFVARVAPLPPDKYVTAILLTCWFLVPLWLGFVGVWVALHFGWLAGLAAAALAVILGRVAILEWRGFRAPGFLVRRRLAEPIERARRACAPISPGSPATPDEPRSSHS